MIALPPNHDSLRKGVRSRRERRELWEREGEQPLAHKLAMVGSLGWLIVIPTLIGIAIGRWLDAALGTGITFTAALLGLGVVAGSAMAWNRVHKE